MTSVSLFLQSFWNDRDNFADLVKWDFKEAYMGTYIGLTWALLKPIIFLVVISFGLSLGLGMKSPIEGMPLRYWLVCGLLPWMFISESLSNPIHSIVRHSYLVKKIKFNVSLIPISKIASAFLIHLLLMVLFLLFLVGTGKKPTWHWLQLPYLMLCATLLLSAISLMTASMYVFARDIGQIFNLVTTLGIWVTPVFWPSHMLKGIAKSLLFLNPFTYIVEGYRASLIDGRWHLGGMQGFVFWVFTITLLIVSMLVFRRLDNHFADAI